MPVLFEPETKVDFQPESGGVQFEPEGEPQPANPQEILANSRLALQGPGRPLMGLGASRAITPADNPDLDELRDQLRGTGIKYAADVINAGIPWAIKGVSNLLPGINNAVEEGGATILNSPETLRYWLMKAIKPITGVEPEYNPPFKPGESIFPTPKEPFLGHSDTFLGSMVNDLAEQIRGMATPGVIVSAGGAGLEGQLAKEGTGLAGRLIAGYYGGEIGASLPDAATQAFDILGDPKSTPAQKGAAIARVGGPVALGALLLHGAAKNAAEKPAGSLPSGELKPTEAPNAEAIRSGEGQLPSGGIIPEGIQETGGNVVEQKPPQQPKPVETGIQFEPEQAGEAKPSGIADRASKLERLKQIKSELSPLVAKGGLTRDEAQIFKKLNSEANDIRFDLQKPLDINSIPSPEDRQSTIPSDIVITARNDLMKDKAVYSPIIEAAVGVSHDAYTPVDSIMLGKNPSVSPQTLYNAFNATREAMRKHYGDAIRLFRAVGKQRDKPTTNWATTEEYAKQFGEKVITKNVPIDDVIAVNVGQSGKYHEIIVGKRPLEHAPTTEQAKVETVGAPAVEQTAISKVKKGIESSGERTPKAIKSELLQRLDEAISAAPDAVENGQRITISIPDDGDFTIWNDKKSLQTVRDAAARISTSKTPSSVPRVSTDRTMRGMLEKDINDAVTVYGSEQEAFKRLSSQLARAKELELPDAQVVRLQRVVDRLRETNPEPTAISKGPGAAASGEPGSYSPIQRMADELRATADENEPIDSQISNIEKAKSAVGAAKDYVANSLSGLKAMADAVWNKWTGLPEYGDEQRAVGKWNYAIQKADHEARQFAREVVKAVPDKVRREAITNWIQADGDMGVLQSRSAASKGRIKQGYEIAQRLTEREKQIAQMLREYYDQQLERGIASGILKEGLPNYITQVWKKENPITKRLISELSMGKLQPNFRYARKRIFDSYFEGEQAGYKPNKDAGFLVANYDQTFNRSLAARAFIKDLHEGVASDGRPLVEISGNGKLIGEEEGNQSVLIKPKAKGEDLHDYRTIDHPALRGWKWATKTPEGQNIFVQGDMLVHPEAYQKLKNRLSISAFRQNPYIRAALNFQTNIKQTMLSVSGFHQVQETLHALGHRVNPMGLPEIDFTDPITKAGVEHGLQLADYNALQSFSEGLTGGGLLTKIPYAGKYLHAYNEWLFQDYIPRLKLQLYKSALERNRNLYPKLPEDKLMGLTAGEANSAFGELPYRYWGRNPTLQDAFRTFLLAPDFLEARGRFVGRAVKPYGREQLMALGYLAAAQYVVTRILNQTLDGDPHWEPKNMFRVVAGNHAYGLRTIPGDLLHLFSDSRGFLYNRMSPMLRTAVTFITGRDSRGIKRDISEQAKDLATMPIPISLKPRNGQTFWEGFMNSFGVQTSRWDATQTINERVKQFKQSNNITDPYETVYNPENDKFAGLRNAIERGNHDAAMTELVKLRKDVPDGKIWQHFKLSMTKPLTGSRANDDKFKQSLGTVGLQELKEAQDLRLSRLKMIQQLMSEKPK